METVIITTPLQFDIYGFGDHAINKDYVALAFKLSGRMWEVVKSNNIKNKGQNIWVYDAADKVFAGVELYNASDNSNQQLEKLAINLGKYAYYKHTGPYHLIKSAGQNMTRQLNQQGYTVVLPYIEIYGHWNNDENKLVTELFMCLQ